MSRKTIKFSSCSIETNFMFECGLYLPFSLSLCAFFDGFVWKKCHKNPAERCSSNKFHQINKQPPKVLHSFICLIFSLAFNPCCLASTNKKKRDWLRFNLWKNYSCKPADVDSVGRSSVSERERSVGNNKFRLPADVPRSYWKN